MLKEFILRLQPDNQLVLQQLSIPSKPNYDSECKYDPIDVDQIVDTAIEVFLALPSGTQVNPTLVNKIRDFLVDNFSSTNRIKFHFTFPLTDDDAGQNLKDALTKIAENRLKEITLVFYKTHAVVRRETHTTDDNTPYHYCPYVQHQEPYVFVRESRNAAKTLPVTGRHSQLIINGQTLSKDDHQKIAWCEKLLWLIRHKQFRWSSAKQHPKYKVLQQLGNQVQATLDHMSFLPSSTDANLTISQHIQQCSSQLFNIVGELISVFETSDDRTLDEVIDLKQDDSKQDDLKQDDSKQNDSKQNDSKQSPSPKAKILHSRGDYLHHLGIKSQFTAQLITHLNHGAKLFPTEDFVKCLVVLKTKLQKSKKKWDDTTGKAQRLEQLIDQLEQIITTINNNQSDANTINTQVETATNLVQTSSSQNDALRDKRHPILFWQRAKSWTTLCQAEQTLTSFTTSDNAPS
ncbi:MAG: hypothetical protein GKR77_05305 [Legionellales bacterium]|nr:hypothetical protein [Legionellales bacterium]